jgi:hypothetical protein
MLKNIQIKICTNVKYMDKLGNGAYQPFVYSEISPKHAKFKNDMILRVSITKFFIFGFPCVAKNISDDYKYIFHIWFIAKFN